MQTSRWRPRRHAARDLAATIGAGAGVPMAERKVDTRRASPLRPRLRRQGARRTMPAGRDDAGAATARGTGAACEPVRVACRRSQEDDMARSAIDSCPRPPRAVPVRVADLVLAVSLAACGGGGGGPSTID